MVWCLSIGQKHGTSNDDATSPVTVKYQLNVGVSLKDVLEALEQVKNTIQKCMRDIMIHMKDHVIYITINQNTLMRFFINSLTYTINLFLTCGPITTDLNIYLSTSKQNESWWLNKPGSQSFTNSTFLFTPTTLTNTFFCFTNKGCQSAAFILYSSLWRALTMNPSLFCSRISIVQPSYSTWLNPGYGSNKVTLNKIPLLCLGRSTLKVLLRV